MPRLRQVPRSDDNAPIVSRMYKVIFGDRDPITEPGTSTGTRGDWWTVFANSPDILEHAVMGFRLYQRQARDLDAVHRELGQARIGWVAGSQFVFSQHSKSLRGLGVSDAKIDAVAHWQASDEFDETERLVLAYTDCLGYGHGRVPDELFDKLKDAIGEVAVMELTYITTMYLQHAVITRALRLENDDVDERVAEVRVDGAEDRILTITDS